jgi:hypothetical protein
VEKSKVPKFFGQKLQDAISALDFMRHINNLAQTNNWSNKVSYNNFANALRCVARKWLFSMVNMLDYSADDMLWTNLKPRFQKQFAVQSNDKLIMEEDLQHLPWNPMRILVT